MFELWSRRMFSFILSALFVASMLAVPQPAEAGNDVPVTDDASDTLIGYWDLRDRETYFQVTNTSSSNIEIHIQVFNVETGCAEFNYFDTLTPRDTHVYNVADLDRNNGVALSAPDLTGGHGILAISEVQDDAVLTGNFRIIDDAGYEYRTNLAGEGLNSNDIDYTINFNNVDGSTLADLVVIAFTEGADSVSPVPALIEPQLYDQNENPISCPLSFSSCFAGSQTFPSFTGTFTFPANINFGINQTITNSKGGPSLCLGNDTVGFLDMNVVVPSGLSGEDVAVFLGLNNGSSTGSLDTVISD